MSDEVGEPALEPDARPSRIIANSTWLVGGRLVVAGFQWFTTLLIIRHLSVDEFGVFSLIFGILGMLNIITDMGLGRIAVGLLQGGRDPERARTAGAYIALRLTLGILGYVIAVGIVVIGGYGPVPTEAAAVAAISVILLTASSAYMVVFQVHERLRLPSISTVLAAIAQLLVVLVLVKRDESLVPFMIPAVAASAVECGVRVVGAHRLQPIRYNINLALWWRLLREAVPISLGNAMTTLYYRLDVVMLSQLSSLAAVATYSVAYKFVDIVNVIPWAVSTAALPALVRHWPDDREGFARVSLHVSRLMAALAGLIAVGFFVLADEVVPLLYGQEYADAAAPAKIVVLSQCLSFAAGVGLLVLIAAGHHKRFPWIAAGGLAFNFAVNLVVLPRYSYMGAAWSTLATDVLVSLAMWWEVRRTRVIPLRPLLDLWRIALGTAVTGVLGSLVLGVLWWPLVAVVMVLAFAACMWALGAMGTRNLHEMITID